MRKLFLLLLAGWLVFSNSCDNPTESKSNPYEQHAIEWPSLADSPWPMYRHDPQFTGRSNFTGPQKGEITWSVSKPGVKSAKAFTSFAIGPDSSIYFGSSYEPVESGTQTWYLYAINPDGTTKWKFKDTEAEIYLMTGPLVTVDGNIIFGAPGKNNKGYVYAISPSGSLIWRYTVDSWIYTVVINIDQLGNLYFCDEYGSVYSLDKNGNLRWLLPSTDNFQAHNFIGIPLSPDGQTIYIPNTSKNGSYLYAFSINGENKWIFNGGDSTSEIFTTPMVDSQGNIYFLLRKSQSDTSVAGLYSIKSDGTLRWKFPGKINSYSEPTIDWDGNIYVYMNGFYTLKNNGELRFKFESNDYLTGSLICDRNSDIYAFSNTLYGFTSEGGLFLQVSLPCEVFSDFAIDNQGSLIGGVPCNENRIIKIK